MERIVFLASGGGGNLKFLSQCIDAGIIGNLAIVGVIADRTCGALEFAQQKGIPSRHITYTQTNNLQLKELLADIKPSIIITNIHKILDKEIVGSYKNRLINLHYSLLPAFKGVIGDEPVRQALELGCKFIGTTVHFLAEEVDSGEIISQSIVPVLGNEPIESLMNDVFRAGCLNLFNALKVLGISNTEHPEKPSPLPDSSRYIFSPPPSFDPGIFSEDFWESIR